jgi:hypothetical protein
VVQKLLFGPDSPAPPPHLGGSVVPSVLHVGGKMVGKIIEHPRGVPIFYHAHLGSQYHRKLDCPAPVDSIVLAVLIAHKITFVYSYDRDTETCYRAEPERILDAPKALYGGRSRHYLPYERWTIVTGVSEMRKGKGYVLMRQGFAALFVPHVVASRIWDLDAPAGALENPSPARDVFEHAQEASGPGRAL